MGKRINRVCGADVHKDIIVATIQSANGTEFQGKFGTIRSELERFIPDLKVGVFVTLRAPKVIKQSLRRSQGSKK